jgi:hypothetical protein
MRIGIIRSRGIGNRQFVGEELTTDVDDDAFGGIRIILTTFGNGFCNSTANFNYLMD